MLTKYMSMCAVKKIIKKIIVKILDYRTPKVEWSRPFRSKP